jgi:phosphate-selective porin
VRWLICSILLAPAVLPGMSSVAQEAAGAGPAATNGDSAESSPAPYPRRYVFYDLNPDGLVHEGRRIRYKPVFAVLGDFTAFDQDDASLAQVGDQDDTTDLRAGRFGIGMRSKGETPWEFLFIADYVEERVREDRRAQLYDLRFRLPVGRMKLDFGKQKQPFVYEMVGLSLTNPQMERILNPFFVSRSVGVAVSGPLAGDRMTWAGGWYNDWLETGASFEDNAHDWVGRITGLARVSADNRNFLHLGLGLRRVGPDAGMIRLSGRPESNVADRYVDTGEFAAEYAGSLSLETVWQRGPVALTWEQIFTRAEAPASGNPDFAGRYFMVSWMLTGAGDTRTYNRALGYAGAVIPTNRTGAFELVARVSQLDLEDAAIAGGELDKFYLGLNWWSSQQWKAGIGYGYADLDRDGLRGVTKMLLLRLQWAY